MTPAERAAVGQLLGVEVRTARPVGGGCIADARRVDLADGRTVFTKSGADLPAGLLEVEAEGLRWLAAAGAIRVPEVLGRTEGPELLVLEWIEQGPPAPTTEVRLGRGLAGLHAAGAPGFGWHRDGFIGPLPQRNDPAGTWPELWFGCRIGPLARRAIDAGKLASTAAALVDRLGARLPELVGPPEPPARVHGDLWSGNVLTDAAGEPWIVDPAPYGGHREVDLAMLSLFGSPGPAVFAAYEEVAPLAEGWRSRLPLWQLEPLLVHTVLFGGGYGSQALTILRRFT
jgi:fructosamine-3-kinase